jgi:hypothetical protein
LGERPPESPGEIEAKGPLQTLGPARERFEAFASSPSRTGDILQQRADIVKKYPRDPAKGARRWFARLKLTRAPSPELFDGSFAAFRAIGARRSSRADARGERPAGKKSESPKRLGQARNINSRVN